MSAPMKLRLLRTFSGYNLNISFTCYLSKIDPNKSNYNKRCYCTQRQKHESQEDKVKPPARPQRFLLDKLISFITSSSDKLEKKIPSVFQVYRTFKTGVSGFVSDSKDFYKISTRLWSGESLENFTRKELELYRQFSTDLPVVGLIFVIVFAPGGAAAFPLAYVFPRFLLSHHFWTSQQKEEFMKIAITKQVNHYDNILDYMHLLSQHIEIKATRDSVIGLISKVFLAKNYLGAPENMCLALELLLVMSNPLVMLDSNVPLRKDEIIELLPLFAGKPFNTDCLSIRHSRHLSKSLRLSLRRKKLVKDALFLHFIDSAMSREGTHSMTDEEVDRACCWRGLNPHGMRRQEKLQYLENWTQISKVLHEQSISLLLHLPVLLSYCEPSNRELVSKHRNIKRGRID